MIDEGCVLDFWCAPQCEATGAVPTSRPPDLLVKFKFVRLRDWLLAEMHKRKGLKVTYPGVGEGVLIKAYEVLTGQRHSQFHVIRRAAL